MDQAHLYFLQLHAYINPKKATYLWVEYMGTHKGADMLL